MTTAATLVRSERQCALKNTLLNAARWVTTVASSFCVMTLVAHALGPRNTGLYGYALWICSIGSGIAGFGLPDALAKYMSEYVGCGNISAAVNVARKLLLAQAVIAAAGALIGILICQIASPSEYGILVLAITMIVPQAMQQALSAVLTGMQRFDHLALTSLITAAANVTCIGTAYLMGAGVRGMILASTAALVCNCLAAYMFSRSLLGTKSVVSAPSAEVDWKRIRKFLFASGYILFLDIIVWQRSEILFLKLYSTLPQIAFYSIAFGITQRAESISGAFTGTLMTLFSGRFGQRGLAGIASFYPSAVKFTQIIMLPVCLLGLVVAKPLVQVIFGAAYVPMVPVFSILLATTAITSLGGVTTAFVTASDRLGFSVKYGTLIMFVNIGLDLLLIPRWGALGAAVANSAAQMGAVIVTLVYIRRLTGERFPWDSTLRVYVSAVLAAVPTGLVLLSGRGPLPVFATAAAGLPIYMAALIALRELGSEDFRITRYLFRPNEYGH